MTIEFTKEELQAVVGLMDAGVRAAGLQAVRPETLAVLAKIQKAMEEEKANG